MNTDGPDRLHRLPAAVLTRLLRASPPRDLHVEGKTRKALAAVDWRDIADEADRHVVGLIVYRRLLDLQMQHVLPDDVQQRWAADARHAFLQHTLQERDAREISAALHAAGIRHAFIKGQAYRQVLYRPAWIRVGGDVDILVDPTSTEDARAVMTGLGFVQASCTADYQCFRAATPAEIHQTESQHHELAQFVRDHQLVDSPPWLMGDGFVRRVPYAFERAGQGPVFHTCVDVHWAIHFVFGDAGPLESVQERGGLPCLSPEWNVVISSFKLYFEAFDRPGFGLHHLVDIASLLQGPEPLDWRLLRDLIAAHQLDACVFYTFHAAERLAQTRLTPSGFLEEFRWEPPTAPALGRSTDMGDFVPLMLDERIPVRW